MKILYKATIFGQPITKKNSSRIVTNKRSGRYMIISSAKYKEYESSALKQLSPPNSPINTPVNVKCIYYMANNRRCDTLNLMAATHDILVKAKVVEDDNSKIITSVDGSRVFVDKENPRVEITIEEETNDDRRDSAPGEKS